MTGQLGALAQGKAAGAPAGYTSKLLKTGQTTQYNSELDDGYYQIGVAKSYTVNTTGAQSGTTNVDLTHLVSDTGAFTAADKTYTDAGKCGVFKADGGETIVISGSASNNGTFTTESATANTVVFVENIVNEADAPATTFKKREAISNNTVLDNNTGLEWTRYKSTKLGALGTGLMQATGVDYDAYQYCAACNVGTLGGHNDWRIPNVNELQSILFYGQGGISGAARPDITAFPSTAESNNVLTSTANPDIGGSYVLVYGFQYGIIYSLKSNHIDHSCFVYLVRGGTA